MIMLLVVLQITNGAVTGFATRNMEAYVCASFAKDLMRLQPNLIAHCFPAPKMQEITIGKADKQ